MKKTGSSEVILDEFTRELLDSLFSESGEKRTPEESEKQRIHRMFYTARETSLTKPILDFFAELKKMRDSSGVTPQDLGFTFEDLVQLAEKHRQIDEHHVTVGGRLCRALPIVEEANARVKEYVEKKDVEAPSGIELWEKIKENARRIKKALGMKEEDWNSFSGQLRFAINSLDELMKVVELPDAAYKDIREVTKHYRMRLTPYYASLIMPGKINDPILVQCVPTREMIDNAGIEIPPVAADHSPARLIDQFYPRVLTIKATNMCAMYCTHCLRIAHIGKKDRIYSREAYREALDYIKQDTLIRDVLITGGDAFILPNDMIRWLLGELDKIDHVRMKRLGTRIPVTSPMRVDEELLDILEESNDIKPLRVVTQVNTAQEITPVSREAFKQISKRVSAVMNQAVLLKGINDTRVKMWKLCETIHEAYIRPYYVFNCSFRNPQFSHLRVPVEVGQDIIESMYGNISGDAIPRYIATAGGKIPLHRTNVVRREDGNIILRKPWSGEEVAYPDADPEVYANNKYAFARYWK
ncbi:MAG TPA: KamA family radical SAM protein [Deltaproteobacteria bacterium]|nr:KamA family radical SAM protein [Deltaproteobacteria bacterium]